ncbi:MAG: hypothetical protein ABSA27_01085 [Terriglobales bacterium]
MSGSMRVAFVSGQSQWWRKQRLVAKYLKMRLEGVIYPDVYCLALMLSNQFDFLLEDEKVPPGKYDLVLAELQSSDSQLRYLESLVEAGDPPVAVIPGPPAILSRDLTDAKLRCVKRILCGARHVWAYSPELKTFCDGLIGHERAAIIPWPYDLAATQKLRRDSVRGSGRHKILVQAPMSFHDIVQNHPFVLKGVLLDVWQELPSALRERLSFHTFVYNSTDLERYKSSEFSQGLPFVLEGKRSYRSFVRFLGECDGVINLTSGSILGRITFLAAALGVPEFSATTARSMPVCIPAREWQCSTRCGCANWSASFCLDWPTETSTSGFCHRLPRLPKSETFRRTRHGCGRLLPPTNFLAANSEGINPGFTTPSPVE